MSSLLFRDARLIDGTGAPPRLADVRVSGNRIVETTSAGALPIREGEDTISCRGATLMPGLIEPHAHLSFVDQATPFAFQAIPIEERDPRCRREPAGFQDQSGRIQTAPVLSVYAHRTQP